MQKGSELALILALLPEVFYTLGIGASFLSRKYFIAQAPHLTGLSLGPLTRGLLPAIPSLDVFQTRKPCLHRRLMIPNLQRTDKVSGDSA